MAILYEMGDGSEYFTDYGKGNNSNEVLVNGNTTVTFANDYNIQKLDTLLYTANSQLEGDHLKSALQNVDRVTSDLKTTAADLKRVMANDVPVVMADAKSAMSDIKNVTENVRDVDIAATIGKVPG